MAAISTQASSSRIRTLAVTKRFVLVLVLEFVGPACWDIALRSRSAFTGGQAPIVHRSVTPVPGLFEDSDSTELAEVLSDEAQAL